MPDPKETPEQWANMLAKRVAKAFRETDCDGIDSAVSELAAVKRDADAMRLWRAEALAHQNLRMESSVDALRVFNQAQAARIDAGLE